MKYLSRVVWDERVAESREWRTTAVFLRIRNANLFHEVTVDAFPSLFFMRSLVKSCDEGSRSASKKRRRLGAISNSVVSPIKDVNFVPNVNFCLVHISYLLVLCFHSFKVTRQELMADKRGFRCFSRSNK